MHERYIGAYRKNAIVFIIAAFILALIQEVKSLSNGLITVKCKSAKGHISVPERWYHLAVQSKRYPDEMHILLNKFVVKYSRTIVIFNCVS